MRNSVKTMRNRHDHTVYVWFLTVTIRIRAHNRKMKHIRLSLFKTKARIAKHDDGYVIEDRSGRLLMGGVKFPSKDVAKEYLNTSRFLHA